MNNPWDDVAPPKFDINVRRASPDHPYDFFWGKGVDGKLLFVFQMNAGSSLPSQLPEIQGVELSAFHSDKKHLVLSLKEKTDWEMFLSLCRDLLQATCMLKSEESVVPVILRRLARWQQFLSRGSNGLLSEAEIKGLIGEVLFMENSLTPVFGIEDAVRFWQGPEGYPQDFNVGDMAIEVKCQSGGSSPNIRISSLEQLNSQLPEMYLYVLTLGKAATGDSNGIDLVSLVSRVREKIVCEAPNAIERFNDLLHACRYSDREAYRDYSYIPVSEVMLNVRDGFPRINLDAVPSGVSKVTYSISLDECMPYEGYPSWFRREGS